MDQSKEDALNAELARLPGLSHAQLKARWLELYGKPLKGARRKLLKLGIAYRLQEEVYGGLSEDVLRQLRQLRAAFARDPDHQPMPRLKPGTCLVREWRGVLHEVTVLEKGFSHGGQTYETLSEVARTITGTRWSGPLFFGLRKPAAKGSKAHSRQRRRAARQPKITPQSQVHEVREEPRYG